MRLLFAGTPEVSVRVLAALLDSDHTVVAALTRADARTGRGRTLAPSPVRARAEAAGLPVWTDRPRGTDFEAWLRDLAPDCAVAVAYGEILRPEVLAIPAHGWVNLHFSVLPAWRGAAPVQRAIIAGDQVTGATTFRITPGLDEGPVYGATTETVRPRDTAGDLLDRLTTSGTGLLLATLDAIADGSAQPIPQPGDGVSAAAKLTDADARVVWQHPALAVDRLIRGCTPVPGAWTTLPDGARLGLGPVRPRPDVVDLPPGRVRAGRRDVLVGTASHAVELGLVAAAGRKHMAAADWARGARLADDAVLGAINGAATPAGGASVRGACGGGASGNVASSGVAPSGAGA